MPAAIANAPSTNAYAPQRNTRAVRVICGQANAKTPNAIAATPRNTKAHQLLVNTINMASLLDSDSELRPGAIALGSVVGQAHYRPAPAKKSHLVVHEDRYRTVAHQI